MANLSFHHMHIKIRLITILHAIHHRLGEDHAMTPVLPYHMSQIIEITVIFTFLGHEHAINYNTAVFAMLHT
jgi:hypothetical protein